MKQEITEKQEAYICVCFLLKRLGYKEGSRSSVVIFDDDYVYDEDPDHPESHRKGEIRFYDHYYKNSDENANRCEMPTLEEINMWLLKQKGYYICLDISSNRYFGYQIFHQVENLTFNKYKLALLTITSITSPDVAYIRAFIDILSYLCGDVKTLGEHDINKEKYYKKLNNL